MPVANLTTKELEILAFLARGSLNKEISAQTNISLNTVKKHTTSIYKKLQVRNRSEAIVWYIGMQNRN
jgi:DNA-binding NarL/FixJ family response regulator